MTDRSIRSLANLPGTASTSRVLNLVKVQAEHGHTREWARQPLFRSPLLNRCLVLKHRLRRDEIERFQTPHRVATKILLPFDPSDFRAGGRSVFIDEAGYERSLHQYFGTPLTSIDHVTLRVIDRLPSLDPFLLREQLRRHHIPAADCYFSLSPADLSAMTRFVSDALAPLVNMSLGPGIDLVASNSVRILLEKILSNSAGEDLGPLGRTLQLEPEEHAEGVFCWKGFLYYKWVLDSMEQQIVVVGDAIRSTQPRGRASEHQRVSIERRREAVCRRLRVSRDRAAAAIDTYDRAFGKLTGEGRPTAFRDFLRAAPTMFFALGEQLGAIQHIVSFWGYRMSSQWAPPDPGELIDLLADFEASLMGGDDCSVLAGPPTRPPAEPEPTFDLEAWELDAQAPV